MFRVRVEVFLARCEFQSSNRGNGDSFDLPQIIGKPYPVGFNPLIEAMGIHSSFGDSIRSGFGGFNPLIEAMGIHSNATVSPDWLR